MSDTFKKIADAILGGSVRWILSDGTDDVMFDVTTGYVREWPGAVTERPIEDRTTVSDHVRRNQQRLDFNGLVNSDVRGVASILLDSNLDSRVAKLEDWRDNATLLSFMGKDVIDDVVIESMTERKSAATRDAKLFSITLRKVKIATAPIGSRGERAQQSEDTPR